MESKMKIEEVKKVCFAGGGTMGCFNSLVIVLAGYDVMVYDVSPEALKILPERQQGIGQRLVEGGIIDPEALEGALTRVKTTTDPEEAAANADLFSESVFERLELKQETHALFDSILPDRTIMTTNSSYLLASEIDEPVKRKERFAALHFHLGSLLVDVAPGSKTSPETIDFLTRFAKKVNLIPIVLKKEKDGYIHNSMLMALLETGLNLVVDGYATFKDVDRSWMVPHGASGPFAIMDGIGLDLARDVLLGAKTRYPEKTEQLNKSIELLDSYVERGELGAKTGKGFYTYPDPAYSRPGFLTGEEE